MLTLFVRNFIRMFLLYFSIFNLRTRFISFHVWHKYNPILLVLLSNPNCLDFMIPSVIELCSIIVAEFTALGACYGSRTNIHHPKAKITIYMYIFLYNALYNCLYLYIYKSVMDYKPIIITERISAFWKLILTDWPEDGSSVLWIL
jgi:hypothetical protein